MADCPLGGVQRLHEALDVAQPWLRQRRLCARPLAGLLVQQDPVAVADQVDLPVVERPDRPPPHWHRAGAG